VDVVLLIGRILFGLLLVMSGIGHLTQTEAMSGYAESRGVRPGRPLVIISGLGLVAGGLGIILGIWIDLAAIGMAVLLILIALGMHHFWTDTAEARSMDMIQFQKDLALAGGALILFAVYQGADLGRFLITDPLF
jgi:uncharacterized membrane protein YphA (DoxX/SURF4 family)